MKEARLSEEILESIDKRAEIGSNAGQIRTVFPALSIPIAFPLIAPFIANIKPPFNLSVLGLMVWVCWVVLSFFIELDRANNDVIIRHAIAEYRSNLKRRALLEKKEENMAADLLAKYLNVK